MNVSMIMEFMNECFIVSCDISGVNTTKINVGTVKGNDFINLSSDIENASEAELTVIMSVLASGAAIGKKVTSPNAKDLSIRKPNLPEVARPTKFPS